VKRTQVYQSDPRQCEACQGWFPGKVFDVDKGLCLPCASDLDDEPEELPLVKGGQGRTGEDVADSGCLVGLAIVALFVVGTLAVFGFWG